MSLPPQTISTRAIARATDYLAEKFVDAALTLLGWLYTP